MTKPILLLSVAGLLWTGCGRSTQPAASAAASASAPASTGVLAARWHPAGFEQGDDNYTALHVAADGRVYYVLCSHKIDKGGQMFVYNPATDKVTHLGDLTEVVGEKDLKAVPQGKSHVPFFEHQGKLYFATHLAYYQMSGPKELVGAPPPGYKPYPGGHFLTYDLASGKFERLATAPSNEGIITMMMDPKRGRLYGITWPSALFLTYDLKTRELKNLGFTAEKGEKGSGPTFRVVCRAMALDPLTGDVYYTVATGEIWRYDFRKQALEKLEACTMKRTVFGFYDPDKPGHMGYNWRQIVRHEPEKVFYGVHGDSGYLFRFDPRAEQIEVLDRIASEKSRASGFHDAFRYGYLGLLLAPDNRTLYYLTGTPGGEEMRLVTYDIPDRRHTDHGALVLEDGSRPNWAQSIALGRDKRIYAICKVGRRGHLKIDLLSFPDPLHTAPAPEPRYTRVRSWDGAMLKEAHANWFDKDGNVIIVDSVASRVHRFTPEGKHLNEIGQGPGSGPGQFNACRDAKAAPNGDIYVLDTNNYRIQVFSHEGKFLRQWGGKGSGPGQFLRTHGLDFSPDGRRLYVVDVDNNRVSVFDLSGKLLFEFGKKGVGAGEFRDAHGLGVDGQGNVYVSNYYGPMQKFSPEGKFLFEYGFAGFRGWIHFHSMTADKAGNTYLAARAADGRNAVVKFDSRGAYVTAFTPAAGGKDLTLKSAAADSRGQVYVTIETRDRHGIEVFRME